jgi:hypothetical protein
MKTNTNPQPVVWWILWAAFQIGIVIFYQFLGGPGGRAEQPGSDSSAWLAGFVPFLLSAANRWLVLPRIKAVQQALAGFVVGIALAEACCFLGLFIFPAHKLELFVISFIGIFQYMPFFAGRYNQSGDQVSPVR